MVAPTVVFGRFPARESRANTAHGRRSCTRRIGAPRRDLDASLVSDASFAFSAIYA